LQLNLGGTSRNSEYGALAATGNVNLNGELVVTAFYNVFPFSQFLPAVGNSFDILDWGTRSGVFSTISLPGLIPNLSWDTSQLYTTGVISVVATAGVAGDYNGNGVVDAADYVVWRKTDGTSTGYSTWRTHFGQTFGSGSDVSANTAVPEPTTLVLLIIAAAGWCLGRRRAA
jgi:hypothetical protein